MNTQEVTKDSSSPTIEPKKSARLAQKRKLREEAATPVSEDDFCFPSASCKCAPEFTPIGADGLLRSPSTFPKSPSMFTDKLSTDISALTSSILVKPTPNKSSTSLSPQNTTSSTSAKPSTSVGLITDTTYVHPQIELSSGIKPETLSTLIISPSSNFTNVPKRAKLQNTSSADSSEEKWLDALELESSKIEDVEDLIIRIRNPTEFASGQQQRLRDMDDLAGLLANPCEELEILSSDETELRNQPEQRAIVATEMRSQRVDTETAITKKKSFERVLHSPSSGKAVIIKPPSHKPKTLSDPKIIYLRRAGPGGRTITFPPGMGIPIRKTVSPLQPPVFIKCMVEGCANRKKYTCSKTEAPLCSLACYKVNLEIYVAQSSMKDVVGDNKVPVVTSML